MNMINKSKIFSMVFLLILITALAVGDEATDRGYIIKVGDPCPDFTLELIDGRTVTLEELKGQIIMLQFTASWCSVCRKEMPFIENDIWIPFKDKGLALIGVDRDEPFDTVVKFAEEMKITYPLALDPGAKVFQNFAHEEAGVTRNIIIDKKGKIVFLTRLFEENEFNSMVAVIADLLE
jgi:peroxiredoxin